MVRAPRPRRCLQLFVLSIPVLVIFSLILLLPARTPIGYGDPKFRALVKPPKQPQLANCDPYKLPGLVTAPGVFTPLTHQCPAIYPSNLTTLIGPYNPRAKKKADREEGRKLKGKKVVFYGDSIERFLFEDFCELLSAPVEVLPDRPGYRSKQSLQALHRCRRPLANDTRTVEEREKTWAAGEGEEFEARNVYLFGLAPWSSNSSIDTTFLSHHPSIAWDPTIPAETWRAENRMNASWANITHIKSTGKARQEELEKLKDQDQADKMDVVVLGSGMWDLPWLQRWILNATAPTAENKTAGEQPTSPPEEFLSLYKQRLEDYVRNALRIHPSAKKFIWLTLHDPYKPDIYPSFQLDGLTPKSLWTDRVTVRAFHQDRVRALRITQMQVVKAIAGEKGKGRENAKGRIEIWPYHEWVRGVPWKERWRDENVHVSAKANMVTNMALTRKIAVDTGRRKGKKKQKVVKSGGNFGKAAQLMREKQEEEERLRKGGLQAAEELAKKASASATATATVTPKAMKW